METDLSLFARIPPLLSHSAFFILLSLFYLCVIHKLLYGFLFRTLFTAPLFQHRFYKNAIPFRRIIDKNMCHCSDHFSILQNRRTAHALNDTSGFLNQRIIRHLERQCLYWIPVDSDPRL